MSRLRTLPGTRGGERGMSLPELLVAMLLFSLLVVGWATFEAVTNSGLRRSVRRVAGVGQLEIAAGSLRRDIRHASLFLSHLGDLEAGREILILQCWQGSGDAIVVWRRDAEGTLWREQQREGSNEPLRRIVARNVMEAFFHADADLGIVRWELVGRGGKADGVILARNYEPASPGEQGVEETPGAGEAPGSTAGPQSRGGAGSGGDAPGGPGGSERMPGWEE